MLAALALASLPMAAGAVGDRVELAPMRDEPKQQPPFPQEGRRIRPIGPTPAERLMHKARRRQLDALNRNRWKRQR